MEARRVAIACCAALLGLALAAGTASAAAPQPGKTYSGNGARGGPLFLKVSKAGTRLADYFLGGAMRCTDGHRRYMFFVKHGEGPAAIDGAGAFSYRSKLSSLTYREKGHKPLKSKVRTSFSGRFSSSDQATGTLSQTLRSGRLRCSGSTSFTVNRNGTPRAPYRNTRVATGSYAAEGRHLRLKSLRVLAPSRELLSATLQARTRCTSGREYVDTYALPRLYFTKPSELRLAAGFSRKEGRHRNTERLRLALRFYRSHGVYRVRGEFRTRDVVRSRGGRTLDRCKSGRLRFKGRFLKGPEAISP